jgi:hypothetical protein
MSKTLFGSRARGQCEIRRGCTVLHDGPMEPQNERRARPQLDSGNFQHGRRLAGTDHHADENRIRRNSYKLIGGFRMSTGRARLDH